MARVKKGVGAHKRHKKILKQAKGYWGARKNRFRVANQAVFRAMAHSYKGRKLKKRDFRKLWITRINAAARMNGMTYSAFMNGLKKANVDINRKMLSEIAVTDPQGFQNLIEVAKSNL